MGVSFVPVGVQYGMSPNPIAYSDQHNPSAVAMTINGLLGSMSCDHISMVLAYLDPRLVVTLRECLDMGGMWPSNHDQHRYNDHGAQGNRDHGGGRNHGKGGKGRGGGSGKSRGKGGKRPALPPVNLSFCPEKMPPTTAETGEAVAFQAQMGAPWTLMGPSGGTFKWVLQPREVMSEEERFQIKTLLTIYADSNKIDLNSEQPIKLALRRSKYWVSLAGGISSAQA